MFSLLFISLVVYLDLLCWTVLSVPWLFLSASLCVWLETIRTIGERNMGGRYHGWLSGQWLLAKKKLETLELSGRGQNRF